MPTATYIALANTTLTGTASSITFSSIPATYRDLVLVTNVVATSGVGGAGEQDIRFRFNSDSGNNYNRVAMTGNGSATASFAVSNEDHLFILLSSSVISTGLVHIMDYSATDKHKTVLARGNLSNGRVQALAGRWADTSAITSITCLLDNFASGGTLALYGIVS